MEENSNLDEQINNLLAQISDFNNGNDELVYVAEGVLKAVSKYAKKTPAYYLQYRLMELYVDLSVRILNNAIRETPEYQSLQQDYQKYLAFYLEAANKLKRYVQKCEKTGDVDNLDSAYLMTIYLAYILANLTDYAIEMKSLSESLVGGFVYIADDRVYQKLRDKTEFDVEEIKKLMKDIEEEGI